MDLFDSQWRHFRASLPILITFAVFHSTLASLTRRVSESLHFATNLTIGLVFVFVLHGYKTFFILTLVALNFVLTRLFSGKSLITLTWIFNLSALLLVSSSGESWPFPESLKFYSGMEGWAHHFNMLTLKMISFGIDYSRISTNSGSENLDYKSRQESPRPKSEYSFRNYFTYLFYSPLYIAGPTITFNAFQSQMLINQVTYSKTRILVYMVRFFSIFFLDIKIMILNIKY